MADGASLLQINTVVLLLEREGSSSAPATVSKLPSSASAPSVGAASSKSITELSGSQDGGLFEGQLGGPSSKTLPPTQTSSCTKTVRTTVVQTAKGPVETKEELVEGGPECQSFTELSNGQRIALFPTLTSSSSSSLSVHTGGTKQSQLEVSKSGLLNPFDLGAFTTAGAEDDVPDLHARSVKSTRVERRADYVGKGTEAEEST